MRQVFSSPRLQNVEGVADLLRDAGIEVRITDGRSYRSGWSGRRTYREDASTSPRAAVWVVRSEDQPRARALLRDAGLLHDTTMPTDSYLPDARAGERTGLAGGGRATRYKILLLVAIAVVIALAFIRGPGLSPEPVAPPSADVAVAETAPLPAAPAPPDAWRVPVPTALAVLMARRGTAALGAGPACLTVDGDVPDARVLEALADTAVRGGDACTANAPGVDVFDYRTDGTGRGTVRVATAIRGDSRAERRFAVRREGDAWQVEGEVDAP